MSGTKLTVLWTLIAAGACLFFAGMTGGVHGGGIGGYVLLASPFLVLLSIPAGIVDVVRCRDRRSKVQLGIAVGLSLSALLVC